MGRIEEILFSHQDEKYGDFISKLIPTLPREKFIGIRSPEYKKIYKELKTLPEEEIQTFLKSLPHKWHEENALHMMIISKSTDFDECISLLEAFIPYVDNWAISDGLSSKPFKKNPEKLVPYIKKWIENPQPYSKRVAMILLKKYYLQENFNIEYLEWAAKIRSEEYYVNMMIAWLFADALVFQWDVAVSFLTSHSLEKWTHNKSIQKACESFRITDKQKKYLKELKY